MTEEKRNASMVGILIGENHRRKILLCRTKKNPEFWQPIGGEQQEYTCTMPKFFGGTEDDEPTTHIESFNLTAYREIREETGLDTRMVSYLTEICRHPSKSGGEVAFYSALLLHKPIEPLSVMMENNANRCDEIEEAKWVYLSEAVDLPTMVATKAFLWQLRHKLLQEDVKSTCKGVMELTKEISHD
jgi:8-oxo-dGTP pyrophosphatase MutT (NUDIX family)